MAHKSSQSFVGEAPVNSSLSVRILICIGFVNLYPAIIVESWDTSKALFYVGGMDSGATSTCSLVLEYLTV